MGMSGFVLGLRFFIVGGCFCLYRKYLRCKKKSCISNDTPA